MSEHRPGPWTVGAYQNVEHRLVPPAHAYPIIGEFGSVAFVIGAEEEARLIAAAPDLLAALEEAVATLDYYVKQLSILSPGRSPSYPPAFKIARATIAKATGKEESAPTSRT